MAQSAAAHHKGNSSKNAVNTENVRVLERQTSMPDAVDRLINGATKFLEQNDNAHSPGFEERYEQIASALMEHQEEVIQRDPAAFLRLWNMLKVHHDRMNPGSEQTSVKGFQVLPRFSQPVSSCRDGYSRTLSNKVPHVYNIERYHDQEEFMRQFRDPAKPPATKEMQNLDADGFLTAKINPWMVNRNLNEKDGLHARAQKRGERRAALEIALHTLAGNHEQHFRGQSYRKVHIREPDIKLAEINLGYHPPQQPRQQKQQQRQQQHQPQQHEASGSNGYLTRFQNILQRHRHANPIPAKTKALHKKERDTKLHVPVRLLFLGEVALGLADRTLLNSDHDRLLQHAFHYLKMSLPTKPTHIDWTREDASQLEKLIEYGRTKKSSDQQTMLNGKRLLRKLANYVGNLSLQLRAEDISQRRGSLKSRDNGFVQEICELAKPLSQRAASHSTLPTEEEAKKLLMARIMEEAQSGNVPQRTGSKNIWALAHDLHKADVKENCFSLNKWNSWSQNRGLKRAHGDIEQQDSRGHVTWPLTAKRVRFDINSESEDKGDEPTKVGSGKLMPSAMKKFDAYEDCMKLSNAQPRQDKYIKGSHADYPLGETRTLDSVQRAEINADLANKDVLAGNLVEGNPKEGRFIMMIGRLRGR